MPYRQAGRELLWPRCAEVKPVSAALWPVGGKGGDRPVPYCRRDDAPPTVRVARFVVRRVLQPYTPCGNPDKRSAQMEESADWLFGHMGTHRRWGVLDRSQDDFAQYPDGIPLRCTDYHGKLVPSPISQSGCTFKEALSEHPVENGPFNLGRDRAKLRGARPWRRGDLAH